MIIKQVSIFVANKPGRLAAITKMLGERNINILAMSIADTTDYGILRLIVTDVEAAEIALKDSGLTVKITEVIGISVSHEPGGLAKALSALYEQEIGIEYMYAFVGCSKQEAMVILKVEDNNKAIKTLQENNIKVLTPEFIENM